MNRSWFHDSRDRGSFLRPDVGPYSHERGSFSRYKAMKFGFEFGLLAAMVVVVSIGVIW